MTQNPESLDRFVVEADRKVVGIAVRVAGGFRFFASDAAFAEAETRLFPRSKAMARSIAAIARRLRQSGNDPNPDRREH